MNLFDYIGVTRDEFIEKYLHTGLVIESVHKEFPLNLFTYGRKAVQDNVWDKVTSRCRGIVVHRDTAEIVARPFEKFHNYGSALVKGTTPYDNPELFAQQPYVIEKLDGFLCTLYRWQGKAYIASKGSFHSVHAKWATAEYNKVPNRSFPEGFTPVFEGLCRDLRIVVDYGDRTGLVLLALINNETGEELTPNELSLCAGRNGFDMPRVFNKSLGDALEETLTAQVGEEGYVLTWYNVGRPPDRLKLKFTEYLRLHRMVTGVSPKRIWEVLSQATMKVELNEYLMNSTPWFSKFVTKWITALRAEYDRMMGEAHTRYQCAQVMLKPLAVRKAYAEYFTKPENVEFAPILFAMLDGKDPSTVIWKRVKELTNHGRPMVDIHSL